MPAEIPHIHKYLHFVGINIWVSLFVKPCKSSLKFKDYSEILMKMWLSVLFVISLKLVVTIHSLGNETGNKLFKT